MRGIVLGLIMCVTAPIFAPSVALGDTVVAARTIRSQTLLSAQDLALAPGTVPGTISNPHDIIGMEARVALYAGRPIRPEDIGPPALVERNQIVTLAFETGGLSIHAEGRALARGGVGDVIRVMNLGSRSTVSGTVMPDGRITVSGGAGS